MPADNLGILLLSGSHERAHYAFMLAVAAAAIGRPVVMFASNEGCRALLHDWSSLRDSGRDATVIAQGVAGFDELREAALELGVRLLACEAGLRMAVLPAEALLPAVEVAGIPTFLIAVGGAGIVTL
ncbi:MAG: DsrE family protein [Acetobacteraceae bacterium]|nr:DsrE family protein [Acetobacteraceae bacterium]